MVERMYIENLMSPSLKKSKMSSGVQLEEYSLDKTESVVKTIVFFQTHSSETTNTDDLLNLQSTKTHRGLNLRPLPEDYGMDLQVAVRLRPSSCVGYYLQKKLLGTLNVKITCTSTLLPCDVTVR
ncbi:hypothetical protein C0J52_26012 [Blattella germanica]|nr:hypothetical protein C0J52_26012 [Blattella germanica]